MEFTFDGREAVSGVFRRLEVSGLEEEDGSDRNPLYSVKATARRFTWASLIYTAAANQNRELQ